MSVSVTTSFQDFAGAASGVPLPVNFPVMAITDIFVAKLLVGAETFVDLVPVTDYTRTDLGGGNYEITTTATYASSIVIRVYRLTPNIQEYIFATTGPMNPEQIVAALDFRCMVEQEIAMLASSPPMAPSAGTLTVPGGGTGRVSLTAYALLTGGTTALGALQQVASLGTSSPQQYLGSNGAGALPSFKTPPFLQNGDDATFNSLTVGDVDSSGSVTATDGVYGNAIVVNNGTFAGTIRATNLTAARAFELPNAPGTLAITSSGQFLLLDGSRSAPTYSFTNSPDTGIYRDAGGALSGSVDGTTVFGVLTTVFEIFEQLLVTIGAAQRFSVSSTEITASLNVVPEVDNAVDLGTGSIAWRDLYIGRNIFAEFVVNNTSDIVVASATTIAPVHPVQFVSGAVAIVTITPPTAIALTGGRITLIPTGAFTWTNAGNIAIAGTAVVGKAIDFTWQSFAAKWYPSYV